MSAGSSFQQRHIGQSTRDPGGAIGRMPAQSPRGGAKRPHTSTPDFLDRCATQRVTITGTSSSYVSAVLR